MALILMRPKKEKLHFYCLIRKLTEESNTYSGSDLMLKQASFLGLSFSQQALHFLQLGHVGSAGTVAHKHTTITKR